MSKLWFINEVGYYRAIEKHELDQPVSISVNHNKQTMLSSEKQVANWHVQFTTINVAEVYVLLRILNISILNFKKEGVSRDRILGKPASGC